MAQSQDERQGRILIVDDDEMLLYTIEEYLLAQGYSVDTARDGADALEKLIEEHYDLLLTDLNMPGMSGLDLIDRVTSEHTGVTPVLMSTLLSKEIKRSALQKGAWAHLDKPFTSRSLLAIIETFFGEHTPSPLMEKYTEH